MGGDDDGLAGVDGGGDGVVVVDVTVLKKGCLGCINDAEIRGENRG